MLNSSWKLKGESSNPTRLKYAMRCSYRNSRSAKKAGKQGRDDSIKRFSTKLYPTYLHC